MQSLRTLDSKRGRGSPGEGRGTGGAWSRMTRALLAHWHTYLVTVVLLLVRRGWSVLPMYKIICVLIDLVTVKLLQVCKRLQLLYKFVPVFILLELSSEAKTQFVFLCHSRTKILKSLRLSICFNYISTLFNTQ